MQRPKRKGARRGVSSAPQVPAGLEKMSIVGSNRRANPSSRPNIGGADTHRSEGSLRSQASSSFQRQYGEPQQETLGGGASSGHHPVIAALQSCVKVFCTAVAPSYMLPWMRGEESHRVGSAFAAILPSGERRIFTHAQVVENCTLVQVRRAVDAQKFVARVVHVGFDVDIAVLHVDDPAFWEAIPALPLPTALLASSRAATGIAFSRTIAWDTCETLSAGAGPCSVRAALGALSGVCSVGRS